MLRPIILSHSQVISILDRIKHHTHFVFCFYWLTHQKSTEQNSDLYSNKSIVNIGTWPLYYRVVYDMVNILINPIYNIHFFLSFFFCVFFFKKINSQVFPWLIRQIYFSNIHPKINKFFLYHAIQDRFAYNFKYWYL